MTTKKKMKTKNNAYPFLIGKLTAIAWIGYYKTKAKIVRGEYETR